MRLRTYRLRTAIALGLMTAAATPSAAAEWLVLGTGTLVQTPPPPGATPLEGVPLDTLPFSFAFFLTDSVPSVALPPFGGTGEAARYSGAITSFSAQMGGYSLQPTPLNANSVLVINDSSPPSGTRADQFTHSAAATVFEGALQLPYVTDLDVPANVFVSLLSFGRTEQGSEAMPPTMLSSAGFPDPAAVWTADKTFMQIGFRAGTPGTIAELNALPQVRFNVAKLQLLVQPLLPAVPEPATWAMLVAGFGLIGATIRRRGVAGDRGAVLAA